MPTMLLYATLGLACVLVARKPVRRAFGAGPAFTLWLLLPLLAVLPWLPSWPTALAIFPQRMVLTGASMLVPGTLTASPAWGAATVVWMAGSALMLLRLVLHYARLHRESRKPTPGMLRHLQTALGGLQPERVRIHAAGPGVLWAPHSLLLLPEDFPTRFDAEQRRLIIQHERMHLRRGDPLWSVLAEVGGALLWFHPLAWLALPRLRLDQELACDERVLRTWPRAEARYARTLLNSIGAPRSPVLIPWLAEPQLKERLNMIRQPRPGAVRRRAGFLAVAALLAGGAFTVQGSAPPHDQYKASADPAYTARVAPQYPADAVKNHDEGTVVLDVLVGVDGKPRDIKVHSADNVAPSLVKAASEAAAQWRFNPAVEEGKPIESYARVPVIFQISEGAGPPDKPDPASPTTPPPPPTPPAAPPPPPPGPPPPPPPKPTAHA